MWLLSVYYEHIRVSWQLSWSQLVPFNNTWEVWMARVVFSFFSAIFYFFFYFLFCNVYFMVLWHIYRKQVNVSPFCGDTACKCLSCLATSLTKLKIGTEICYETTHQGTHTVTGRLWGIWKSIFRCLAVLAPYNCSWHPSSSPANI